MNVAVGRREGRQVEIWELLYDLSYVNGWALDLDTEEVILDLRLGLESFYPRD